MLFCEMIDSIGNSFIILFMSIYAGQELKKAREERKIPLTKVSDDLFIRITYLQAIENGQEEILPSVVQGRGFVRMYADYLNLDSEKILHMWDEPDFSPQSENKVENSDNPNAYTNSSYLSQNFQLHPTAIKPLSKAEKKKEEQLLENKKQSQQMFKEIGLELKAQREKLGLSLADCEKHTLVRQNYLQSIENGNYEELPSYVQARGMLNNYTSFLNVSPDRILLKFATALQLQKPGFSDVPLFDNKPKPKADKVKTPSKIKRFLTPDLFVGITVLLGMAGIIIYSALVISQYKSKQILATSDVNVSFLQQIENSSSETVPTTTATPEINPIQNAIQKTQENQTGETEQPNTAVPNAIQINITANQRAFLSVKIDGKDAYTGRTVPGNSYPFYGDNLIEITTGNGAALSVIYNQQNLGTMGKLGEVVSMQFTRDMAITPTLVHSLTPTSTFEATYTPMPEIPLATLTLTPYIP